MKICYDNLENIYFTSRKTFRTIDGKTRYIYKDECKECKEPFLASYKNQKFCCIECKGEYKRKNNLKNKKCKICGETDISKFYIVSKGKSKKGLSIKILDSLCKKCRSRDNERKRKENPERWREYERRKRLNLKLKILNAYGGKCECCGEDRYEFLAIDHIDGGGNKHKKKIKKEEGKNLYYWLLSHDFPEGFRVLCHNCNQSLGMYGYCPHQKERK